MAGDAIFIQDGFDLGAIIYLLLFARNVVGGDSHDAKAQKKQNSFHYLG
jgi:hypothetical protein